MEPHPRLLPIPGGTFQMGKEGSRADETPVHTVTVSPFRAAESPVTNAEYAAFVQATGVAQPPFVREARFAAPSLPVVGINWFDATAYCEWLSERTGIRFRLPTEAEREFAALGGQDLGDWPWHGENTDFVTWVNSLDGPHPPSERCANGFGLRCMAENVHEWCLDWYDPRYYAISPSENPHCDVQSRRRTSRGGAWRHRDKTTRVNARSSLDPTFRYADYGFRVYADG